MCLKYCLIRLAPTTNTTTCARGRHFDRTHAKTFENSEDGDMTKLSFVCDQEIKCCML